MAAALARVRSWSGPALSALLLLLLGPLPGPATPLDRTLTDYGIPALGAVTLVNGLTPRGLHHNVLSQALVASGSAAGLTYALKQLTGEPRPGGAGDDSFPSGHASGAFALARVLAHHGPRCRPLWYGLAAGIAWSRVSLKAHFPRDVVAGAALGSLCGGQSIEWHERPGGFAITLWKRRF